MQAPSDDFVLSLYLAGQTPKCLPAFAAQRVLATLDVLVGAA